jgi:hypothetical protein
MILQSSRVAPVQGGAESPEVDVKRPGSAPASAPPLADADELLRRIQGEFLEMPGMRLTVSQAQRLWGLGPSVCDTFLRLLVERRFLSETRDGSFVRADSASAAR